MVAVSCHRVPRRLFNSLGALYLTPNRTLNLVLCRDHRMSLAETVPYLRWRTTQLAQFELTYALKDIMGKVT